MKEAIKESYDVVVIGGGPAGLAAAVSASDCGAGTLMVEREARIGGILKQCIHDGFGLVTFNEKLTGPEYAERYIHEFKSRNINIYTATFVTGVSREETGFCISLVNAIQGVFQVKTKAMVLATGCRERTSKQVLIAGTRPAGIYTAGTAQYFVNIMGYLPCKKCVILGSGDIGLIMARRLTLEGAHVVGVFEAKNTPSGLSRNVAQCLADYEIPLELSHTITRVIGEDRVSAVEIAQVDETMKPIAGTQRIIECDGIILSVGLIPENELAENLGVMFDKSTKGPVVDEHYMTTVAGVFSCGNALHVNDLVDYVTESGTLAGKAAAEYSMLDARENSDRIRAQKGFHEMTADKDDFLYIVPQKVNSGVEENTIVYFRSRHEEHNIIVNLICEGEVVFTKKYSKLKPPEMERLELSFSKLLAGKAEDSPVKLMLLRQ